MLRRLFGRKKAPTEGGVSIREVDQSRWVKKFELVLSNMEDTPSYELTHQLTVGREVGNIIVNDASISPRHATFTLQENVVSVIDHGSSSGTFVNGNEISVGKFIILQEGDLIRVGDLELKLTVRTETLSEEDLPPAEIAEPAKVAIPEETKISPPPQPQKNAVSAKKNNLRSAPKKKKNNLTLKSYLATNALTRVLAILGDFVLAYIVVVLFHPFDEFRDLLNFIPQFLADILQLDWSALWSELKAAYESPVAIIEDLGGFLSSLFNFLPLLLTYALIKLSSTLLFGVSLSQYAFGMRAGKHGVWARVGGVLRVLIGFITWPFLIFDLPALVSRRTFKEVITFTHLYTASKLVAFLGAIIYPILLIVMALTAPLFQGLEMPVPIAINTRIDERVVVEEEPKPAEAPEEVISEVAPDTSATTTAPVADSAQNPESTPPVAAPLEPEGAMEPPKKISTVSHYLGLALTYQPEEFSLLPVFKFFGGNDKTKIQGGVAVTTRGELEAAAELELLKRFDMKQLLGIALRGNPLFFNRYPHIYDYVYSADEANTAFKSRSSATDDLEFAKEFIDLMKISFELSVDNFLDIMQTRTPLLNGMVDFKSSFLALVQDKGFSEQEFVKIGNTVFLRLQYLHPKTYDLLIPLIKEEGRVYKLTYKQDERQENNLLKNKLYKYAFYNADWTPEKSRSASEMMTPLEVLDAFTVDFPKDKLSLEKAQALYGFYFEKSTEILTRGTELEYQIWNSSLSDVVKILEAVKSLPVPEGSEDPKAKLLFNFRDLKSAFENRNREFFGITPTVVQVSHENI